MHDTQLSLAKDKINILLLEGIHPSAEAYFRAQGYNNITSHTGALSPSALKDALADCHFIGIRSRTQLNAELLAQAPKLNAIGCFCIGTNQVDLTAAMRLGIPVFNAPFSNTRSVAELVLGEILLLLRRIPEKNALAHRGIWQKTAQGAFEARGKTLGIIGYGRIGSQLSILAENLGMRVIFYDIVKQLPLNNAQQVASLDALLAAADIVSLHVPETPDTEWMMGQDQLAKMKAGSLLINAARGRVVDIHALADALKSGQLAGAAIDVFPTEPETNKQPFESPLRGLDNVLLTPHIGGSTEEAQASIGQEVAAKLVVYSDIGTSLSAVNFPEVALPEHTGRSRLLHIHHNQPGVLTQINQAFAAQNINIAAQYLQTNNEIGYVVIDLDAKDRDAALAQLKQIPGTLRTRLLH
ncbi:3-phosphoglycerate dehydrogenase [Thiomicrospira aerophila AL3]|uniref:D-3-phosphoglycerate dehydrogenase n=1 Tax=Thiomicrospira aerophila AL3 TaxID=717772 RepID=W0DTZ5_9GAMM|nr:phosphoglycerate dehydrogenase [Thiomicrospira aerophila]AHF00723.1 3-phosphoglycerate dehydrogenase [Thiomicrospira aerophila AL3]